MADARVIGSEHIEQVRQSGRLLVEVLPGDIVTAVARETAVRLGVTLIDGPVERPVRVRTDGNTQLYRGLYRRSPRWVAPIRTRNRRARRLSRLALIGAGGVGANIAHLASVADIAHEITLIDITPGLAAATAMDINHASGITATQSICRGSEDFNSLTGADVVVVSAGRARSPGMSRADLTKTNRRIIHRIAEAIRSAASEAVIIVVSNPVDEMTVEMLRETEFPRQRVLGMAGTLDSSRFRNSLARAAGVQPGDVTAWTLGSHGDEMTPVVSRATIKGRPLSTFLSSEQIAACVDDTVTAGGQVVALRKTGSATIAPAHACMELVQHLRGALSGPVPASVMLDGEYGLHGVVLGVPCHLGAAGLLEIEQWPLETAEHQALLRAAQAIKDRLKIADG